MNNFYNMSNILAPIVNFSNLGYKKLLNGTELIAHAPYIASEAWLFSIYPPLQESDIVFIEKQIGCLVPKQYREWLLAHNGLNVFNTTFSLYGLRRDFKRTIESVWQPFDIITPNREERPQNATEDILIIGGYDWGDFQIYISNNDSKVYMFQGNDITPIFEWENFQTMLKSEIERIMNLHDNQGKLLDEDICTLPITEI